jgi:transposase InsO family protein
MVRRFYEQHQPAGEIADAFGVSERTVYKWLERWRAGGERSLDDGSSTPACQRGVPDALVAEVARLRRQRMTSPKIAARLAMPLSTVTLVLRRLGLNRLAALEPRPPVVRYQRQRPGELLHIDTKKLGRIDGVGHRITGDRRGQKRGSGWDFLHVCVDDASRLAYTEILPDERKQSAVAFLGRALAWFARHGVTVERVMTDNGSAYRSHDFRRACNDAELRHLRTRPYTPRTNGKAERFIQTVMRECAYAQPFLSSKQRTDALAPWTDAYNRLRPHCALAGKPPITKLAVNNVLGNDT